MQRRMGFFRINRPPSRHKTPPKAVGLELPEKPHTPPKTQKELEEYKSYSQTINLKGIGYLANDGDKKSESDYDSFSSSMCLRINLIVEEIKDVDEVSRKKYESPEIIISHNGKQISTPRAVKLLTADVFTKATPARNSNTRKLLRPAKNSERPGTVAFDSSCKRAADLRSNPLCPKGPGCSYSKFGREVDARPVTTAGKGMRVGYEYLPQRRVVNAKKEVKKVHGLNPSMQ
eukprot:TRINITY_DN6054_c0_g1_i4.p1 TRINITY_DN6054_c0_g1~~TRINITY_DN6054_c0_g1_i4.p1  ORF type:complete len:232 (-),score=54.47 TRINITY_DN6054_c0_g1_i4:279-974(-)